MLEVGRKLQLSRRDFIKLTGTAGASLVLALYLDACSPFPVTEASPGKTEIGTPIVEVEATEYRFLTQDQVLAAKLTDTEIVQDKFDEFVADEELSGQFDDPSSVTYSAMGIEVRTDDTENSIIYPFFSAVSQLEEKGVTAIVYPSMVDEDGDSFPETMRAGYDVLSKVVKGGVVGLGVYQNVVTGVALDEPSMVFSTGLSEEKIAKIGVSGLMSQVINFALADVWMYPDEMPGGTGVQTSMVELVPATPPAPGVVEAIEMVCKEAGIICDPNGVYPDPNGLVCRPWKPEGWQDGQSFVYYLEDPECTDWFKHQFGELFSSD